MKVLLLDTAFAAVPIYNHLIEAGHDVWVMGNRPKDVLAVQAGTRWIEQDYSKVEAVAAHTQRLGIKHIIPGCTDVSIETTLCLGLNPDLHDSVETNKTLSNKASFRRLCTELNLPAPRRVSEASFPSPGKFICKPVDAFSGRGITIFDGEDSEALNIAIKTAKQSSPSAEILIETFATGQLYSCSAFIKNHRLTDIFYVIEGASANPFAVDTSHVIKHLPEESTQKLEASLEKICSALELKDGLLHTQFILSDREPCIVELARRCPGDLYSLLIEYSTGFSYAGKYAGAFIGEDVASQITTTRYILRHTVTSLEQTTYAALSFSESLPVRAFFPILQMGDALLPRQGSRAGILFTEANCYEQVIADYTGFMRREAYKTDKP